LFWLIPSIRSAHLPLIDAVEKHLKATEDIVIALQQTNVELARLRCELASRSSAHDADESVMGARPGSKAGVGVAKGD
jgi:hypothetical protein